MSKFKVGDRVRRIVWAHGGMGKDDVGDVTAIHPGHGFLSIKGFDPDPGIFHDPRYLELVKPDGPVRDVTRKIIVLGTYGRISIKAGLLAGEVMIGLVTRDGTKGPFGASINASEVRTIIETLTAILPALEQDK